MASQIEQTLASLTALSRQYTAKIDGFFKTHHLSLRTFRSTTLDSIEKAFRRFESDTLASRSPLKSLRKQSRRRLKKSNRSRKTKPKPRLQPPPVIASTQRGQHGNGNTSPFHVSRPLHHRTLNAAPPNTQLENPVESRPLSTSTNDEPKRDRSKRLTRSTSSFQSAVESPILDLPTVKTAGDENHHKGHSTDDTKSSPAINESQWEDCQSEPELSTSRSNCLSIGGEPVVVDLHPAAKNAPTVSTVLRRKGHKDEVASKARLSDKKRHDAEIPLPQVIAAEQIDQGSSSDIKSYEERCANAHPSDTDQLLESEGKDEEEQPAPILHRKRGVAPVTTGCQPAEDSCDLICNDKNSSLCPLQTGGEEITNIVKEIGKQSDLERQFKNSTLNNSSSREELLMSSAKIATDEFQPNNKRSTDFEFKAPKPRPVPTIAASYPQHCEVQPAVLRTSDIQTTSSRLVERHTAFDAQKQNMFLKKHFAVDEGGKINDDAIGALSEIAATSCRGNEGSILRTGERRAQRGTKLFQPTTDIYTSQRKPTLSKVHSVQKSNMSSRASLLSHTPGAHAPLTRFAKNPVLTRPSSSNLRESLAALKQPITDTKSTEPLADGKTNVEAPLNDEPNILLHSSDEQGLQTVAGGKRLAFAEQYKQIDGGHSQTARAQEPQTAPTKAFRQPRIRRCTEKSALRRRIEEIRRQASTSTVMNRSTRFSSEEHELSATAENRNNGTSEAKCLAAGTERISRDPDQTETTPVEDELIPSVPKPSSGVIPAASSTSQVDEQDALTLEQVSERAEEREPGFIQEKSSKTYLRTKRSGRTMSSSLGSYEHEKGETDRTPEVEREGEADGSTSVLSNLMSSVASLYPGASSILGVRTNEERREETDAEIAAKRQRLDAERREAERLARMEAQRAVKQKEAEDKQRRAEMRRQLLAEAERAKEEERKRKEEHRKKVKQQEDEQRKRKKLEEDRKKEERRRQVLEKKALNMELQWKKTKGGDGKRQRQVKVMERGICSVPKASGLSGKMGKGLGSGRSIGKGISPTLVGFKEMEAEDGKQRGENGIVSYVMTPAKATVIEESDEEAERRKHKVIPQWAGERNLAVSARSQADPDKVFVNMPMCNLREVFGSSKQYRTRSSSANWTQDRVTTSEMTRYKKAVDGYGDA